MGYVGEGVVDVHGVEKRVVGKNYYGIFKAIDGNEVRGFGFFVDGEGKVLGGHGRKNQNIRRTEKPPQPVRQASPLKRAS